MLLEVKCLYLRFFGMIAAAVEVDKPPLWQPMPKNQAGRNESAAEGVGTQKIQSPLLVTIFDN